MYKVTIYEDKIEMDSQLFHYKWMARLAVFFVHLFFGGHFIYSGTLIETKIEEV